MNLFLSAVDYLERAYYRRKLSKFKNSLCPIQGIAIDLISEFVGNSNELSFGHPEIDESTICKAVREFESKQFQEIGIASPEWTRETYVWSKRDHQWVILFSESADSVIETLNFILTKWPIIFPSHAFNKNNKDLQKCSSIETLSSVQLPFYDDSIFIVFFSLIQTQQNILSLRRHKCVPVTC
jgi:hypothetical protein